MPIKIEKATLKDLDELQNIENECFNKEAFTREQLTYLLEAPNAISLTAKTNQKIIGFIIGLIKSYDKVRVGHIYTIDVALKHRRTGIGLKLLEGLEQKFQEKGVKKVYLEVRADNKAALELYHRKGYVELQPLENYYSKGTHGFRMKKELKK